MCKRCWRDTWSCCSSHFWTSWVRHFKRFKLYLVKLTFDAWTLPAHLYNNFVVVFTLPVAYLINRYDATIFISTHHYNWKTNQSNSMIVMQSLKCLFRFRNHWKRLALYNRIVLLLCIFNYFQFLINPGSV